MEDERVAQKEPARACLREGTTTVDVQRKERPASSPMTTKGGEKGKGAGPGQRGTVIRGQRDVGLSGREGAAGGDGRREPTITREEGKKDRTSQSEFNAEKEEAPGKLSLYFFSLPRERKGGNYHCAEKKELINLSTVCTGKNSVDFFRGKKSPICPFLSLCTQIYALGGEKGQSEPLHPGREESRSWRRSLVICHLITLHRMEGKRGKNRDGTSLSTQQKDRRPTSCRPLKRGKKKKGRRNQTPASARPQGEGRAEVQICRPVLRRKRVEGRYMTERPPSLPRARGKKDTP